MIVLDASVVIEMLLWTDRAGTICNYVLDPEESRHAPHLLDVEVAQVIRRYWLAGEIDVLRGNQMMEDFANLPIDRHEHVLLLPRIWQLHSNLTAYDAAYIALAEALDAPLATCNDRLAAAPGHNARITLL
ncbi:MAG: type II toxin-antitoxin system VapC family toxin [Spirochaetaceae bacterium]|nr:MAG: type II toxin-antitoxin system VapC family toxin [Spirochaetaceae bacterium]